MRGEKRGENRGLVNNSKCLFFNTYYGLVVLQALFKKLNQIKH